MNWKVALILSAGAIAAALIFDGNRQADAQLGRDGVAALATTSGIGFSVFHAVGDKVRYCHVVDLVERKLECSGWR